MSVLFMCKDFVKQSPYSPTPLQFQRTYLAFPPAAYTFCIISQSIYSLLWRTACQYRGLPTM